MRNATFPPALEARLSKAAFEAETAPSCLLDSNGIIVAANRAWDEFARQNGAAATLGSRSVVGTSWMEAISGDDPRKLAGEALAQALTDRPDEGDDPRGQTYRLHCNAPHVVRGLEARFVRLVLGDGTRMVLVTYTAMYESPLEGGDERIEPLRDQGGLLFQCSGCRRVMDKGTGQYRFVPELIARPAPHVSHTICGVCMDLWYGGGTWLSCQQ